MLFSSLQDQQDWDQGKGEGRMTAYYLTCIRVSEVDIFYKIHDDATSNYTLKGYIMED